MQNVLCYKTSTWHVQAPQNWSSHHWCVASTSAAHQPLLLSSFTHFTDRSSSFSLHHQQREQFIAIKRDRDSFQIPMASFVSTSGVGLVSYSRLPCMDGLKQRSISHKPTTNFKSRSSRRLVAVRAEGQAINPEIRKSEQKVVDSVVVTELSKPLTPYCRLLKAVGQSQRVFS